MNTIPKKIRFTLEIEHQKTLPFLDLLLIREGSKIKYTVYRKPTHTNRYLNAHSHHHPAQIQSVANTLISRSHKLTQPDSRNIELKNIENILHQNGFQEHHIKKAILNLNNNTNKENTPNPETTNITLPYIKGTTDRISRILHKHNYRISFKPHQTIKDQLQNPKQKIPLEHQGVYSIPCKDCPEKYVGQTNRRISARVREHELSIINKQITSALFQHHHHTGHNIDFENTRTIAKLTHYGVRLQREAIEIYRHGAINQRDDSINLPSTWKTLITQYKKTHNTPTQKTPPNAHKTHSTTPTQTQKKYNLRSYKKRSDITQ